MNVRPVSATITTGRGARSGWRRYAPLCLGGLVLAAVAVLAAPATAQNPIFLQSELSGKYVRVTPERWLWADAVKVTAKPDSVNRLFYMNESDGHATLRSLDGGKYVRAGVGEHSQLAAVSEAVGGWERFTVERHPDGTISLRAGVGTPPRYVRAGVGTHSALAAVSERIGGWEKFRVGRMSDATFSGDLHATRWCYRLIGSKLVIFPQLGNPRYQDWRVPERGTYFVALGSTNGGVTSAGHERTLDGYPKLHVPAGGSVMLKGISIDYSPNWHFSMSGWGFLHASDQNTSNNRDDTGNFSNVRGTAFFGDGSMTDRRCAAVPNVGWW